MRLSRNMPQQDPMQGFFRRFYNQGMPKPEIELPRVSLAERLVSVLILKPVLGVWNLVSRDRKEALRQRAKSAFGDVNVDRIVNLARKTSPPAVDR